MQTHPETIKRGEMRAHAKLTTTDVLAIRAAPMEENYEALALRYGVSVSLISSIRLGKIWRHLGCEPLPKKGDAAYNTKVTFADVQQILRLRGIKSQREIARQFAVSEAVVSRIMHGTHGKVAP
jgi:hypothetical protein